MGRWQKSILMSGLVIAGCHRPAPVPVRDAQVFSQEFAAWHRQREQKLLAPEGWLSLAARVWLIEGENRLGSDPANGIVFPEGAPGFIGTVTLKAGALVFQVASGIQAKVNGKPATEAKLRPDNVSGVEPDRVTVGRFTFLIIKRGERLALRLFDPEAPTKVNFRGIDTFPPDPKWVIPARFEAYQPPKKVETTTVIQTTEEDEVPGVAIFSIDGREYRLEPTQEEDSLFFVFADASNSHETYGGGRFLTTPLPKNGVVELDFNRAVNPPCSMTAYATCPIPRPNNRLPVRIEAGEKFSGHH